MGWISGIGWKDNTWWGDFRGGVGRTALGVVGLGLWYSCPVHNMVHRRLNHSALDLEVVKKRRRVRRRYVEEWGSVCGTKEVLGGMVFGYELDGRYLVGWYRGTSLIRNSAPPLGPPQGPRHSPTVGS